MTRHHKGRKMREFSYLNERYVSKNYLKYYKHAIRDISGRTGLTMNEINVMAATTRKADIKWLAIDASLPANRISHATST